MITLEQLKDTYKSTANYLVTWETCLLFKSNTYKYFLTITLRGLNLTVLYKSSTDLNYLIDLYTLFMKEKN